MPIVQHVWAKAGGIAEWKPIDFIENAYSPGLRDLDRVFIASELLSRPNWPIHKIGLAAMSAGRYPMGERDGSMAPLVGGTASGSCAACRSIGQGGKPAAPSR